MFVCIVNTTLQEPQNSIVTSIDESGYIGLSRRAEFSAIDVPGGSVLNPFLMSGSWLRIDAFVNGAIGNRFQSHLNVENGTANRRPSWSPTGLCPGCASGHEIAPEYG